MTLIWGTNYSIVKAAFREIDPQAFNASRMAIASVVFLGIIVGVRRWRVSAGSAVANSLSSILYTPIPFTRRDWLTLAWLGVIGHFLYQYLFIGGLARTSVANSSLLLAATPIVIALLSAVMGQDRISRFHWLGALLSMSGLYIVVGRDASMSDHSLTGDLMMLGAVLCWAVYTLHRRSPDDPALAGRCDRDLDGARYVPLCARVVAGVAQSALEQSQCWDVGCDRLLRTLRAVCRVHDLVRSRPSNR